MRLISKIIIHSASISFATCLLNLVLMAIIQHDFFNEQGLLGIVIYLGVLALSPFLPVISGTLYILWCIEKEKMSKVQMLFTTIVAGVLYIILLLTVFQMCCYRLGIGANYGDGLFLAMAWYASLFMVTICILILSGFVVYLLWRKKCGKQESEVIDS